MGVLKTGGFYAFIQKVSKSIYDHPSGSCHRLCTGRLRGSGASSSSAKAPAAGAAKTPAKPGDKLIIRMLDIGQGDAFLLEKDGKFAMIDTGDVEHREALVKYLHEYGVKELSNVIITHPHADHMGGMKAVFDNIKVDNIYDDGVPTNTNTYKTYLKNIKTKNIPFHIPKGRRNDCSL